MLARADVALLALIALIVGGSVQYARRVLRRDRQVHDATALNDEWKKGADDGQD